MIEEKFGRIGYSAIFDSDMRVAWSNEKRLFKKIASSHIFMESYKSAAGTHDSFENILTHNGIRFKAVFLPLPDRRYLCLAYPEDRFVRFAFSEMYMRIFNIRCSADKTMAVSAGLLEDAGKYGLRDETLGCIEDLMKFSECIKYDADCISKIIDADNMCEYVNIREKLDKSYDRIKMYNSMLLRKVTFSVNIDCSVAKINYSIFEAALFEIVRIIYKYIPENGTGSISIGGNRNVGIRIDATVERNDRFDPETIDYEIRDVNCAFEYLGGRSVIAVGKNGLSINAAAPASLSNYNRRVKSSELTDVGENDPYEILSGYTGIPAGELKRTDGVVQFRAPRVEPEYHITDILADLMFSPLVSGL